MGLLLKQTEPSCWGVWKMEETVEELLGCFSDPAVYLPLLEEKKTGIRKKEWLAVRVLLKELLGTEQTIAYHSNGAPYLPDSSWHISISHTKEYVAVILDPVYPVGIDIEYISERIFKVRDRFMGPEEIAAIDPANEIPHLLLYWCAKESLFKVMGEENVDFSEMLHIDPFSYQPAGQFSATETRTPAQKRYRIHYLVTSQFVLTYTVGHTGQ